MKIIKNFDENVYVLRDESGNYHVSVNGKAFNMIDIFFLVDDIDKAINHVTQIKEKE